MKLTKKQIRDLCLETVVIVFLAYIFYQGGMFLAKQILNSFPAISDFFWSVVDSMKLTKISMLVLVIIVAATSAVLYLRIRSKVREFKQAEESDDGVVKPTGRFKLTNREMGSLVLEALITLLLIYLFYQGSMILGKQIIESIPALKDYIWGLKLAINVDSFGIYFVIALIAFATFVLTWRIQRRVRLMQMKHIISELHYIADGHYDYRIPFRVTGDMDKVIDSINALVTSTTTAMEEERAIEKSKDELITNVSHDIRTPLTSIIGYLGLIEDKRYNSEEELLNYTKIAYNKAQQMSRLVEDLFEYTKVRQSDTPLNLTSINLSQLLAQMIADFQMEAEQKNIEMTLVSLPEAIQIEADVQKLVRVFNNLLTNAFKYGEGATMINIEAEASNEQVTITVGNNGKMIPEQALRQLFERFYRVETSRSIETGGSGLGLAISQSIVQLHKGSIKASSTPELTAFIIQLPLEQKTKEV